MDVASKILKIVAIVGFLSGFFDWIENYFMLELTSVFSNGYKYATFSESVNIYCFYLNVFT